ncbi:phage tail protein [Lactiplantibacillus plantarum]|uniref:phage tail protein n=1 Tax=Lactiplantibacillus plantarum TaxID=1590 RepID=UPI00097594EB|nr:phage tail protein [Lactiplantibacillus plantarum]
MSKHGIVHATFALLDDNGDILKPTGTPFADGIYVADHNKEGFTQINVTGIEAAGTPQYADNAIKFVSYGQSQPTIAMTALELNWIVNNMLKGFTQSANTGAWVRQLPKPHVAMIAESQAKFDDLSIYECFNNIEIVEEASNNSTDTNAQADYATAFNATALKPLKSDIFLAANGVQQPYMIAKSTDKGFDKDKLYAEVFGGYSASSPASSPSNG